MPLLDVPFMIQVNWTDADWTAGNPWDQDHANILTINLKSFTINHNSFRGTLREDSLRVTCYDPGFDLRVGKPSSILAPNVKRNRRIRVLRNKGGGDWQPLFFGYIRDYQPDATDPVPPESTITADSPLVILNKRGITLPAVTGVGGGGAALPANPPVNPPGSNPGESVLPTIIDATGLWGSAMADVSTAPSTRTVEGVRDAYDTTVGLALAEALTVAQSIACIDPKYGLTAEDASFVLRVYNNAVAPVPVFHWSAPSNQLEPSPSIVYNGEEP